MGWRIGIDTGGTFTDVVAYETETQVWLEQKIWSRPGDPGGSLESALEALAIAEEDLESVVYGTTVVTNALIQRQLARVALVTTQGFRDVLQISRQRRDVNYGFKAPHREAPLVPRSDTFELAERCSPRGDVEQLADDRQIAKLLDSIPADVDVVAVSLLHSYLNPRNELAVADAARSRGMATCASHEVSPEAREYERTLVTVLNASLLPLMERFTGALQRTRIPPSRLHLFHSAGGMVLPSTARRFPLLLAMSGPAAGVEAASRVGRALGLPYALSFDMGGTTTDCSLIIDGRAEMQMDGHVGPYRVRQPMVAVESIGAGGGSIVALTETGLQVGPQSAGADPGPACYNRGGSRPTVTDAAAILGYFGSAQVENRPIAPDVKSAEQAFLPIGQELGIPVAEAAMGALRVANAIAARAIKRIAMGRGVDARSCVLIAFGGAGPMLACQLASELGMGAVVVPYRSSALSALGCLVAEKSFTRQQTVHLSEIDDRVEDKLSSLLASLEQRVASELGMNDSREALTVVHKLMMRYSGQSYEIEVPLPAMATKATLTESFRDRHLSTYGYVTEDPWECVAVRTTAMAAGNEVSLAGMPTRSAKTATSLGGTKAYFHDHGWLACEQHLHESLSAEMPVRGPALILDTFSTIVVPPNWTARLNHGGHIRIDHKK